MNEQQRAAKCLDEIVEALESNGFKLRYNVFSEKIEVMDLESGSRFEVEE